MITILLLCCFLNPDNINQEQKKELAKWQGLWKGVSMERDGQVHSGGLAEQYSFAVLDQTYTFSTQIGIISLNPAKGEVDLTVKEGPSQGIIIRGLYELKQDSLRLALNIPRMDDRPKSVETSTTTSHKVYVFQRDPNATKETVASYFKARRSSIERATKEFEKRQLSAPATREQFQQLLEKLDRMEKRLEAVEKRIPEKK